MKDSGSIEPHSPVCCWADFGQPVWSRWPWIFSWQLNSLLELLGSIMWRLNALTKHSVCTISEHEVGTMPWKHHVNQMMTITHGLRSAVNVNVKVLACFKKEYLSYNTSCSLDLDLVSPVSELHQSHISFPVSRWHCDYYIILVIIQPCEVWGLFDHVNLSCYHFLFHGRLATDTPFMLFLKKIWVWCKPFTSILELSKFKTLLLTFFFTSLLDM